MKLTMYVVSTEQREDGTIAHLRATPDAAQGSAQLKVDAKLGDRFTVTLAPAPAAKPKKKAR